MLSKKSSAAALFAGLLSITNLYASHFNHPLNIITQNKTITLQVAIAQQPAKMARGLMFVRQMEKYQGMLFVYKQPKILSFWMKNTLIPLDILFINTSRKVIDIQTMLPCKTFHCAHYRSKKPAKYALEINGGLAKRRGVRIGDSVTIPETTAYEKHVKLQKQQFRGEPTHNKLNDRHYFRAIFNDQISSPHDTHITG